MAKHTPGPWEIERSIERHKTVIYKPTNSPYDPHIHAIAFTVIRDQRSIEEIEANARLIARSPSMLALLEKALPLIETEADARGAFDGGYKESHENYYREMRELANEIEVEIKKAKGELND